MVKRKIAFGGGCHWCTEAVFQSLRGVYNVEQGFVASRGQNKSFSEAVIVHFDDGMISLEYLIEVHLHTHSSDSYHAMRSKYRSAVYTFDENQRQTAEETIKQLQADFDRPLVTKVLPFIEFRPSEDQFQNYYLNDPDKPFCQTYIRPKLEIISELFPAIVRKNEP